MKIRVLTLSNIYLLLVALWQLQDVLYEGGNVLSKVIIALFVLLSLLIAFYTVLHYRLPKYFLGLNMLLGLFTIYGLIHIATTSGDYVWAFGTDVANYTYLLSIYLSLLPIYVFYLLTIRGELSQRKIQLWVIVILIISIAKYSAYMAGSTIGKDDGITNNFGYLFVGIISLLVFFNNKTILQYILLAISMVFVMLSMKRGAILVAFSSLIPFSIMLWKQSSKLKRIVLCAFIILFVVGGIYFTYHLLQTNEYFVTRIEDTKGGDSSFRDYLYSQLWYHFKNEPSLLTIIFGAGANATLRITENYAHNDWLEILTNQGLFGIMIYLLYWMRLWLSYRECKKIPELNIAQSGILIFMVASFMMTIFSMSYANLSIGLTMTLGICLGQITLYQNKQETIHA